MNVCLLLKVNVLITKHRLTFQFSYWALFEWLWTSRKKIFEIRQNKTTERIKIICDFIKRGDEKLLSDWQAPLGVMTSYHNEYIFVATKKILCCSYGKRIFLITSLLELNKATTTYNYGFTWQLWQLQHYGLTWSLKSSAWSISPRRLRVGLDSILSHWAKRPKSERRGILLILGASRRFSKS